MIVAINNMPTQLYTECWNCGKSYPDSEEVCPECGEHPEDDPDNDEQFLSANIYDL